MYPTSSAGRLWGILNRVKEYIELHSDSYEMPTIGDTWCEIFEIESPQILDAHLSLLQLITEVIEDFKVHYEGDEEAYMYPLYTVAEALRKVSFDADAPVLAEQLTPSFMAFLKLSDRQMTFASNDHALSQEELNEIRQLADELYDVVCATNIDIQLRTILITIVRELQNAILNYQFFGADGICKANERILGSVLLNSTAAKGQVEKNILKRCVDASLQVAQIARAGYDVAQIATALAYTNGLFSLPESKDN